MRNSNFIVARNRPVSCRRDPIMPVISLFRNYARRRDRIPGYEEARWRFRSVASNRDDTETRATGANDEEEKKRRQLFRDTMSHRWQNGSPMTVIGRETVSRNFFVPFKKWHRTYIYIRAWLSDKKKTRWPANVTSWRNIPVLSVVSSVFILSVSNGETSLAEFREIHWNYLAWNWRELSSILSIRI